MIAFLQAFSADAVSRDCSSRARHTGSPVTSTRPFLSVSISVSFSAGGWVPSLVLIRPEADREIGASFFFGSLLGLKPPLKVNKRFPASTVVGLSFALVTPVSDRTKRIIRAVPTAPAAGSLRRLSIELPPVSEGRAVRRHDCRSARRARSCLLARLPGDERPKLRKDNGFVKIKLYPPSASP